MMISLENEINGLNRQYAQTKNNAQKKSILSHMRELQQLMEQRQKQRNSLLQEADKLDKLAAASGYRKGSHSTDNEINWLHEGEIIYRKSDGAILQPFGSGDKVFTSLQSENLWKMSRIDPDVI